MSTVADLWSPVGTFPSGAFPVTLIESIVEPLPDPCDGIPVDDLLASAYTGTNITVDGQTVAMRSVDDLITLDKYLRNRCKKNNTGWGGISIAKAQLPNALGN